MPGESSDRFERRVSWTERYKQSLREYFAVVIAGFSGVMSVFATVIGGIAVVAVWSLNAQNLELREEVGVCNIYSAQLISELRRLEVNPGLVDKIEKELINE